MNPAEYERFSSLLARALSLDSAQQPAFIEQECAGDPAMRTELLALLPHAKDASAVLPSAGPEASALPGDAEIPAIPQRIGPYRVLERLGQGGMGEVYLAAKDPLLPRLVAIKLIRRDLNPGGFLARFHNERETLPRMDHPNIAKVFDAGANTDGLPFIAMEYIDGRHLDRYCDETRLGLRERLALFRHVCLGVQHAHQKEVIHRDLKPSNVIVTVVDNEPIPKIIDFGVAKAFGASLIDRPASTVAGQIIGTPEYMSPEQTLPGNLNIDTRTDVYSLGMILYVLLAGDFPYDFERLMREGGREAIFRTNREVETPPPSRRVAESASCGGDGRVPRAEVDAKRKALRGDLDRITLKALAKEPGARFASPLDLANDIERFLRNEPVSVGPPSLLYQFGKLVRRHRARVAAVALVAVAVLAGAIMATIGFAQAVSAERQAIKEAARAAQEARTANLVTDLLVDTFRGADPSEARGQSLDVGKVLERGTKRILPRLDQEPAIRARMLDVIGRVDVNLGRYEEARLLLRESLDLRRQLVGARDPEVADSLDALGRLEMETSHPDAALENFEEGLAIRREVLDPKDPRTAASLNNVGIALRDLQRQQEAKQYLEAALDFRLEVLAGNDVRVAESHMNLGIVLSDLGANEAALDHYEKARAIYDEVDPESPDRAMVLDNLGIQKAMNLDYETAQPLLVEALRIRESVFSPNHPDIAISLINLANVLLEMRRFQEAMPRFLRAISIYEARPELGRRNLGWAHGNLAALLLETRDIAASQRHLDEARSILTVLDGSASGDLADILEDRAGRLHAAGRRREAEVAEREVRQIRERLARQSG